MKGFRWIVLSLAGWYTLLIVIHYFNQRPLWNDEEAVWRSIVRCSPVDLFSKPLLSDQAFPRFYLLMIQQFSSIFHFHLWALRFLPFISMWAAFGVWLNIALKEFKDNKGVAIYALCWSASVMLVYYASELKQYSMDVLISGLCLWFLYKGFSRWWYAVPFFCFVSYPSVFWVPLFFWNLLLLGQAEGKWQPLVVYMGMASLALGVFYVFDVHVTGNLGLFWQDHFISFDSPRVFWDGLGKNMNNLISRWFAEKPIWIRIFSRVFMGTSLVYMMAAFWGRFKRDGYVFKSVVPAAFAVFWLHLMAGALKIYPFVVPRTSLFLAPLLLMIAVEVIFRVKAYNNFLGSALRWIFVMFLAVLSLGIARVLCTGTLGFGSGLWQ